VEAPRRDCTEITVTLVEDNKIKRTRSKGFTGLISGKTPEYNQQTSKPKQDSKGSTALAQAPTPLPQQNIERRRMRTVRSQQPQGLRGIKVRTATKQERNHGSKSRLVPKSAAYSLMTDKSTRLT